MLYRWILIKRELRGQNKPLDTEYDNILYDLAHAVGERNDGEVKSFLLA
jgi:hypothetical protein